MRHDNYARMNDAVVRLRHISEDVAWASSQVDEFVSLIRRLTGHGAPAWVVEWQKSIDHLCQRLDQAADDIQKSMDDEQSRSDGESQQ